MQWLFDLFLAPLVLEEAYDKSLIWLNGELDENVAFVWLAWPLNLKKCIHHCHELVPYHFDSEDICEGHFHESPEKMNAQASLTELLVDVAQLEAVADQVAHQSLEGSVDLKEGELWRELTVDEDSVELLLKWEKVLP